MRKFIQLCTLLLLVIGIGAQDSSSSSYGSVTSTDSTSGTSNEVLPLSCDSDPCQHGGECTVPGTNDVGDYGCDCSLAGETDSETGIITYFEGLDCALERNNSSPQLVGREEEEEVDSTKCGGAQIWCYDDTNMDGIVIGLVASLVFCIVCNKARDACSKEEDSPVVVPAGGSLTSGALAYGGRKSIYGEDHVDSDEERKRKAAEEEDEENQKKKKKKKKKAKAKGKLKAAAKLVGRMSIMAKRN